MWEQIRANKRNSIFLMGLMAVVLFALGALLGMVFAGPQGGWLGLIIAGVIWLVMMLVSFSAGDQILLASSRAKKVTPDVHPQLFNVVEEMTIASSLPRMPDIYIIDDPAPNAFATGRNPESASVAVTAGLLARLNRDELQGVIAHEISHILHRDILFVTLAGVMLGTIVLLSNVFLRGMFYSSMMGSRRRYSSRSDGGGGAQAIIILIAILAAILAPIFAQILYFALSRRREYLADAGGARLTRYPEGLASALEKISGAKVVSEAANPVTAPMYIAAPLKGKNRQAVSLYSTHPPIDERIRILRNMGHGASLVDYEKSYRSVSGGKKTMVPRSGLKEENVPIRETTPEGRAMVEPPRSKSGIKHETGDIIRRINGFAFIQCDCGLKMKIPPNYKSKEVSCPRCKKHHRLAS